MAASQLFQPIKIGKETLQHRIVLAPLTRYKASKKTHVPSNPLVKTYYSQRGSIAGTLLITEATFIDARAGGYDNVPGIWNREQINAWREVTDAVHARRSFIYLQLWALGRASNAAVLESEGLPYVAPSAIALKSKPDPLPRPLITSEIKEYIQLYAEAAKNAIEAGFDGVEIHGANGYLIDQFIQDVSNHRTDEYGGSIEGRSRFGLEVVDAVVEAVGEERTAIRLSPWGTFQDMKMSDPIPQYTHFITALKASHPNLAYLHLVEPELGGGSATATTNESNDFIRDIWAPNPLIVAGGFTRESALKRSNQTGDLVAFGKLFISNPDIHTRILKNIPLTPYNTKTFYVRAERDDAHVGYVDYPFAEGVESWSHLEAGAQVRL
ncbi:FMN-linked oxidoreductase [Phlegmacium glaucopus]|nr:FMN-linked oxidoreductase [Phlegmacium glaucopus]